MKEKVSTFSDRYHHFGGFKKIVPLTSTHARELSTQTKKRIRLIKADLSKKRLVDPMTNRPVAAIEYLEWRNRARAKIRSCEEYIATLANDCRKAKGRKVIRPAIY